MKPRAMLVVVALLAALAPLGARANHCASKLIVQAYTNDIINLSPGPYLCLLDDGHTAPVDYRVLSPLATSLVLQYLQDVSAALPKTTGFLDGLGFAHKEVTYTRTENPALPGAFYYITDQIAIPDGATASGCLTFTMKVGSDDTGEDEFEINRYHTVGTSCPDYP